MKKSAYQVWNLAKEQNLNEEQTKELMIQEGIIIKKSQEKTPIQKAISLIEDAFENNEKNAFLREQVKRIRWKLENLLPQEKEHFINFYNQAEAGYNAKWFKRGGLFGYQKAKEEETEFIEVFEKMLNCLEQANFYQRKPDLIIQQAKDILLKTKCNNLT